MDAYQRGYAPGINGLAQFAEDVTVKIGQATLVANCEAKLGPAAESAGFYALSYKLDVAWAGLAAGTTVISYRGTDFDILTDGKGVFDTEFIKDLQYGWTSFLKVPPVPGTLLAYASLAYALPAQFPLARAFFQAVTGSDFSDGALAGANDNTAVRCAAA